LESLLGWLEKRLLGAYGYREKFCMSERFRKVAFKIKINKYTWCSLKIEPIIRTFRAIFAVTVNHSHGNCLEGNYITNTPSLLHLS
jgi:hypothetical protein